MPNKVCAYPFEYCEINPDGLVSFCCTYWIKQNYIGNINEEPFQNIWNSPAAQAIRQSILNDSYLYCNRNICQNPQRPVRPEDTCPRIPQPRCITLTVDHECNLSCITCRKKPVRYADLELEKLNEKIDGYLALLKDVPTVRLSGKGDPFASRNTSLLIMCLAETYPDMRFKFLTNGTLCNRKTMAALGVNGKVDSVEVSLHSATKEMWLEFTRGTAEQYDLLLKNISELAEMKRSGELSEFILNFVLTSVNYTELTDFVKLADKFSAKARIWGYRNWDIQTVQEAEELMIYNSQHRDYEKLQKIFKDPVFDLPCVFLYPEIKKVRFTLPNTATP